MNLIKLIPYIIVALVSLGVGIVVGVGLVGSQFISAGLSIDTIIEVCKLFLVLMAVLIAKRALETWKRQFYHNENFRCSLELEAAFKKLLIASNKHWHEVRSLANDRTCEHNPEELPTHTEQTKAYLNYIDAWDYMTALVKVDLDESFLKPQKLQSKLISFFISIDAYLYDNTKPKPMAEYEYAELRKSGIKKIQGFRT